MSDRAAYMRAYRARREEYRRKNAERKAARERAMRRLAAEYPSRFNELFAEELTTAMGAACSSESAARPEAAAAPFGEVGPVGSPARTRQATGACAAGLSHSPKANGPAVNEAAAQTTTA